MQRKISSLIGYSLQAIDGRIGKVNEFYFDDHTWMINFLIIKTGNWLSENKILLSPGILFTPDWENKLLPVDLTKEQILNSPDIDTQKSVSRLKEHELYGHNAWQRGGGGFYEHETFSNRKLSNPLLKTDFKKPELPNKGLMEKIRLRSTKKVAGYHICAINGDMGHVTDFIINDQTWQIVSLVINIGNWFAPKEVHLSVSHVKSIKWDNSSVFIDIPRNTGMII